MSNTRTRLLAGAGTAVLAGAVLTASPVATTPAEAETTKIVSRSYQQALALRRAIVRTAVSRVGHRYVWGATGPNSFDCSGLVVWSHKKVTGRTLPRTSYALRAATKHIKPRDRQIGDLVFFNGNGHVAIYIGGNKIVHASNPSRGVRIDSLNGWYRQTLVGYSRVITHK